MKNIFYVYEHWRTDRDECFYVGKGKSKRAYNLSNRNKYHKAIVSKVMREGFAIEVRIVASGLDEKTALELEVERIKFWKENNVELANFTNGGEGTSGFKFSKESRQKMSKSKTGKIFSLETCMKISESKKNLSVDTRKKMSDSAINQLRRRHTEQTKRKISEANKKNYKPA